MNASCFHCILIDNNDADEDDDDDAASSLFEIEKKNNNNEKYKNKELRVAKIQCERKRSRCWREKRC